MKLVALFAILSSLILAFALSTPLLASNATGTQAYRLQQVAANANAAISNAHIYQWKRVNVEVNRIDADEHSLEVVGVGGDQSAASTLRQSVLSLRSARQSRDVVKIQTAAQQVIAACNGLLTNQPV
jgi:hypothetical protein